MSVQITRENPFCKSHSVIDHKLPLCQAGYRPNRNNTEKKTSSHTKNRIRLLKKEKTEELFTDPLAAYDTVRIGELK